MTLEEDMHEKVKTFIEEIRPAYEALKSSHPEDFFVLFSFRNVTTSEGEQGVVQNIMTNILGKEQILEAVIGVLQGLDATEVVDLRGETIN